MSNGYFPTWCPGCGNFGIWGSLKDAFSKLGWQPDQFAIVYGVGCSGNMNDFLWANSFHALHGRAVPTAIGVKIANHSLPVIVIAGDGDCYGEGGNHLLAALRKNPEITLVVHNNQVYALTKGQASPTSDLGYVTKVQPQGVIDEPIHPLTMSIALGAGFAARGFAGDKEHLSLMIQEGVKHRGLAVIDVLQWCVTFNKKNNFAWYKKRIYKLGPEYDSSDKTKALEKSLEWGDRIPLGIIYKNGRPSFEEAYGLPKDKALVNEEIEPGKVSLALKEFL